MVFALTNFRQLTINAILVFFIVLIIFNYSSVKAEPKRTDLIQLKLNEKQFHDLRAMKIEFATGLLDSIALAVVSPAELALLKERDYHFKIIMHSEEEVELFKRALYGESMILNPIYHTYDEVLSELKQLVKQYPQLILTKKMGQTTQEKRDIWAVKISDNVTQEEDEPAILFSGAIHADELAGVEICMTLIQHLLQNYQRDQKVTSWINQNEIWFIPMINVDGHYVVTHNIDPRWRKNTRDTNGNGVLYEKDEGIDLNRNFDFNWAHGGSPDSSNTRYRGELPFSESECVAVRELALAQKFLIAVTYHSQGEVVFYPWIWRGRPAPDDKLLTAMANGLASTIHTLKGDTCYAAHYGAGTVGQTYPWLYGHVGTFDFLVETGKGRHIFPEKELKQIIGSNLPGAFYMLDQMNGPGLTGHVYAAETSEPLRAVVWFPEIDTEDIARRTTDSKYGRYFRILAPGQYRVIFMKEGYQPQLFKHVEVGSDGWTKLDVWLKK